MRLIELRAENFKKLVAVRVAPTGPVTPITGKNGAGKTSVLDAIAAALGGGTQAPEMPIRAGQDRAAVEVDLGDIVVKRRWTAKGSSLEVLAKDGLSYKSPQAVLDKFVGELMFDPLAFGRMKPGEQAGTIARVAGIDLESHQAAKKELFDQRAHINRQVKELRGALALMAPVPEGTPDEEVSVAEILNELTAADKARKEFDAAKRAVETMKTAVAIAGRKVDSLRAQLAEAETELAQSGERALAACNAANAMPTPPDLEPIRQRGKGAEGINKAVRSKQIRANREKEVTAQEAESKRLTDQMNHAEEQFAQTLAAAALPVPGLGLKDGGVTLNGIPFGQSSGAERLRTSVAIGLALNPKLKLMLIRDGSLLDADGLKLLEELAAGAGAQVLIERVADGDAVGVRIVDGEVAGEEPATKAA
ncbi:chromosome segregation protein [Gemmata sp. SH-PL17]|uniref:AAA family ATPase n=1 Tax=Gemmata sp. SH-PL17 TaxID=1630693 RepID=UPI00078E113B|nr:ATP-binding protein [Gemmata sp. SH-PL17]AMV24552.1 chromosome segregation protein [Gemmata sp. SH-PL17]